MRNKDNLMSNYAFPSMSLYTRSGERKYVNSHERALFLQAAQECDAHMRMFCMTLVYSGCRVSEALELSAASIQLEENIISFRTLKQRKNDLVMREVPVPELLIAEMETAFNIRSLQNDIQTARTTLLYPWGRTWGWMLIKEVMKRAGISGVRASCKGLRHGFCAHALLRGVPVTVVKKWAGHTRLSTTEIYTQLAGSDEREIATRMW